MSPQQIAAIEAEQQRLILLALGAHWHRQAEAHVMALLEAKRARQRVYQARYLAKQQVRVRAA